MKRICTITFRRNSTISATSGILRITSITPKWYKALVILPPQISTWLARPICKEQNLSKIQTNFSKDHQPQISLASLNLHKWSFRAKIVILWFLSIQTSKNRLCQRFVKRPVNLNKVKDSLTCLTLTRSRHQGPKSLTQKQQARRKQ